MENTGTESLDRVLAVLENFVTRRDELARLSDDQRRRLLIAAGRLAHPDHTERRRVTKALRRERRSKDREADRAAKAETGIRAARQAAVFLPPSRVEAASPVLPQELKEPRNCYVCKQEYRRLHFFYDSMCLECAELNYAKRFQTASLEGRVALISGSRVKIGYQAALKMLRAGARVIVTTRFPHDAAQRYAREEDFGAWRDRLLIYGLDLRHAPSVERFALHLESTLDRLDILINNAAQTVRRPPNFYRPLQEGEALPLSALPAEVRPLVERHHDLTASQRLPASSTLSLLPHGFAPEELADPEFPVGQLDADLQQVDLRRRNSWRLRLAEVSTPELLEVQLVNSIAPYILCGKLRPLMDRTPGREKHIVNVSAMEGIFSRGTKTDKHPHTNMAKAALNMMTLTSAVDYLSTGIHMNAVDTGWVTDEDPAEISARKQRELDFQPPLDIVDGAARICDPFFSGLLTGNHVWGKFLKDYRPSSW